MKSAGDTTSYELTFRGYEIKTVKLKLSSKNAGSEASLSDWIKVVL